MLLSGSRLTRTYLPGAALHSAHVRASGCTLIQCRLLIAGCHSPAPCRARCTCRHDLDIVRCDGGRAATVLHVPLSWGGIRDDY